MSFVDADTRDVADDQFSRQLTAILLFWLSLFLLGTWLLVNYGDIATSVII